MWSPKQKSLRFFQISFWRFDLHIIGWCFCRAVCFQLSFQVPSTRWWISWRLNTTPVLLNHLSSSHSTSHHQHPASMCAISTCLPLRTEPGTSSHCHLVFSITQSSTSAQKKTNKKTPDNSKLQEVNFTRLHNEVFFFSRFQAMCQYQCLQSTPQGNLGLIVQMRPSVIQWLWTFRERTSCIMQQTSVGDTVKSLWRSSPRVRLINSTSAIFPLHRLERFQLIKIKKCWWYP